MIDHFNPPVSNAIPNNISVTAPIVQVMTYKLLCLSLLSVRSTNINQKADAIATILDAVTTQFISK